MPRWPVRNMAYPSATGARLEPTNEKISRADLPSDGKQIQSRRELVKKIRVVSGG